MTKEQKTDQAPILKIGDVVVLKSGGGCMTIVGTQCNGQVELAYFLPPAKLRETELPGNCLRLATEQEIAASRAQFDLPF